MLGSRTPDLKHASAGAMPAGVTIWEAGLIPIPGGIESDPAARLAAALIVAAGFILHAQLVPQPPSGIDAIATAIARAVRDVLAGGAHAPSTIRVRHEEVATALAPLVSDLNIVVRSERDLRMLEDVALDMAQHLGGYDKPMPLISMPPTWAAWQVPSATLIDVFTAAAAFYTSKPWTHLTDNQPLSLHLRDGKAWTAAVMGNAGEEFGLALYEDPADFLLVLTASEASEPFIAMRGQVLSLSFNRLADLPRPMQREIARSGWSVASPAAYPMLWALNTPGGGATTELMHELTKCLWALARFVGVHEQALANPRESEAINWRDAGSGIVVSYGGGPEAGPLRLWPRVAFLAPGLPEGANANVRGHIAEGDNEASINNEAVVERFRDWLSESGSSLTKLQTDVDNAQLFVHATGDYRSIPIGAVTEYDLRVFLYDWFPRKVATTKTAAMQLRASLRRFFEYLDVREGIKLPWARAILRDKATYDYRWETFPGGFFWDKNVQVWQAELYDDLHERVMLPESALAGVGTWGDLMGPEEARLYAELQREWLVWRDELIRSGSNLPGYVRETLALRQADWERQPRSELGGRSASEVIRRERRKKEGRKDL
jgi:uncharacterized protein DUF6930